jgi:uncharacterized protein
MIDDKPLREAVREANKLVVAFSGGLDSAVIAKIAAEELGENAIAVTIDSETMPRSEIRACEELVNEIGIDFKLIRRSDLKNDNFTKNPVDRCYFCRTGIAFELRQVADDLGIEVIADGANSSDLEDYRPGLKAFEEAKIWHPFIENGITKSGVRDLAHQLELSVKDKPSLACLASRIPYHEKITETKLRRVEDAEDFIRSLKFSQVRVRHLKDNVARIEVLPEELKKILEPEVKLIVVKKLKDLGFNYITVDLEGYRTGSMNLNLSEKQKKAFSSL